MHTFFGIRSVCKRLVSSGHTSNYSYVKKIFDHTSHPRNKFHVSGISSLHTTAIFKMNSAGVPGDPVKKIGLVQMTSTLDKEANYSQAKDLIHRAKTLGAQMVFLPECFDYVSQNQQSATEGAETTNGETITKYKDLAKTLDIWLSLGGFHEKPDISQPGSDKVKIFNTHIIIDNSGVIKGRYSKTHLFNVDIKGRLRLQETEFTIPGFTIGPPVDTPVGKVGMAICYDVRFPEISIALTQQGADILTFPSAFTIPTGKAHWETLLKCRAIENQCFVVAAAQTGKHNEKRSSYGHSLVVDPWGSVAAEIPDNPGVVVVDVTLEQLRKVRREMPVWEHRRHDLYGQITVNNKVQIDSQSEYQFGQVRVLSSQVFYRTGLSYAFVNRKPVVAGHVLVSPVRCVPRFTDLSPAEVADLFQTVQKVSQVTEDLHSVSSLTCAVQDGPDAGQTIEHVHVHILPRRPGDFKRNDDVYYELDSNDKDVENSKRHTDDDMTAEANKLRLHFS